MNQPILKIVWNHKAIPCAALGMERGSVNDVGGEFVAVSSITSVASPSVCTNVTE